MKTINLVTSNKNKVNEFRWILGDKFKVNHVEFEYPEIRSDDNEEIVMLAVKQLAEKLNMPVVAEDSGIFIKALNYFPGTFSAFVHKRIGLDGILKLMKGKKDRGCYYKSAVGYCEPGKPPICFVGIEKGKIAQKIRGKYGFGHDPIFIPEGSKKTFGEMKNYNDVKKFRRIAVLKLAGYLNKR